MAGLAPDTLRLDQEQAPANDEDVRVEIAEDGEDRPQFDDSGAILKIEHADGSVTVSLDGKPISDPRQKEDDARWFANLAEKIDSLELSRIAEDLLRGIEDDLQSRKEWIEDLRQGLKLLGLKIEIPGLQGASDGAPVEGMSKVRHQLLLENVLRFQANARAELLPTDGPVKVRDDANGTTPQRDSMADALEQDLNHYLTAIATEYYPDTDRMLLKLGSGGTTFKKVYFCPLRMRPVSETVDAPDLIVNQTATDLANAKRVTQRILMRPSTVRRMQILGVYRDIPLSTPIPQKLDELQREEKAQQGVAPEPSNPEDRDREIYECYAELDIAGYEHQWKGAPSGLEIPYRVTIDVSSREILSIVRNYDKPKDDLPTARKTFVKYTFVPGFGFYDIGLIHILGNTTNALTAALREMLDNGMFANFPGFLMADIGGRQNGNIFRVPPGGAAPIKTNGMPINQAVMPLPYNTQQMAPLMSLIEAMANDGARLGGTSELQVGEGRPDAPVGTTLAMIEQATKVLNSVHKRLHCSQAEEFMLLVDCFREHPESFVRNRTPSPVDWTEATFVQALDDHDLVPQADPNTASHTQRVLKVQALNMWQQANQSLADPISIAKATLRAMGWSNPEQFMAPPSAMAQPPPEMLQAEAKMQAETTKANAAMLTAQTRAREAARPEQQGLGGAQIDTPSDTMMAKARLIDAETKRRELKLKSHEINVDSQNRELDRQAEARSDDIDLAKTVMGHEHDAEMAAREVPGIEKEIGA